MSAGHSEVLRELQLQRRAMEDHAAATRETSEVMRAINALAVKNDSRNLGEIQNRKVSTMRAVAQHKEMKSLLTGSGMVCKVCGKEFSRSPDGTWFHPCA